MADKFFTYYDPENKEVTQLRATSVRLLLVRLENYRVQRYKQKSEYPNNCLYFASVAFSFPEYVIYHKYQDLALYAKKSAKQRSFIVRLSPHVALRSPFQVVT